MSNPVPPPKHVTSDHNLVPNTGHDVQYSTVKSSKSLPLPKPPASNYDLHQSTHHDVQSSTINSPTSYTPASTITPSSTDRSRAPSTDLHSHSKYHSDSLGSNAEPTVKTPLLGIERHDKRQPIPRIPTNVVISIPTKTTLFFIWLNIAFTVMTDIIIPLVLYYTLVRFIGTLWALVISGIPPTLLVTVTAVRERKADGMGILMITSFVISAALATLEGDAKLFILRESLVTLVMGLLFLFTLIPITYKSNTLRPFLFYTARQLFSSASNSDPRLTEQHWNWLWDNRPGMRKGFRFMTGVWGFGLISEFFFRIFLLYGASLEIEDVIYWSNVYVISMLLFLGGFTIWLSRRMVKSAKEARDKDQAERLARRMRGEQV